MGSDQYHLHIATLSRSPTKKYPHGRTSVQMAAYISGSKLHDDRRNKTYDSRYKTEVENSELKLPSCAPQQMLDELNVAKTNSGSMRDFREKFWNGVESHFKAKNAQVGKTIDIAYPLEFSEEERKLARDEFVKIFTDRGYAVDVADHIKEKNNNPHFHMQIAPNKMDKEKTWKESKEVKGYVCENSKGDRKTFDCMKAIDGYNWYHKDNFKRVPLIDPKTNKQRIGRRNEKLWKREKMQENPLNDRENLKLWRKQWETIANKYLPEERWINCKSYKERGINRKATIHLGGKASRIKEESYRYKQNESIRRFNGDRILCSENILNLVDDALRSNYKTSTPKFRTRIYGLNAIQKEKEEEIEEFLKAGRDEEEQQSGKTL